MIGGWMVPEIIHSISASGSSLVMITVTSYLPMGRSPRASRSMWTTKRSPACRTGSPSADWSMPELSMATWPRGAVSTAKIAAGGAAIWGRAPIRSVAGRSVAGSCCSLLMAASLSGRGGQGEVARGLHGQVVGLLDVLGLAGPAPGAVDQDLAALVGGDRGLGGGAGHRAVVQAVRQDDQVGREPVAADVGGLPDLGGPGPGQAAGQ